MRIKNRLLKRHQIMVIYLMISFELQSYQKSSFLFKFILSVSFERTESHNEHS